MTILFQISGKTRNQDTYLCNTWWKTDLMVHFPTSNFCNTWNSNPSEKLSFFIKTQIPYLNKLIIFSLSGFVFGFFLPQNWPKIGFFARTILSNWIKFYTPDFMNLKIQSVNVMNEYYVCFFVKEQKKRKIKEMNKSTKKNWNAFRLLIFIPLYESIQYTKAKLF